MSFYTPSAECLTPTGSRSKAQGCPRFLRATLGRRAVGRSTLKGLRTALDTQPLQGWVLTKRGPRVGRKRRGQPWALLRNAFGVSNQQPVNWEEP